MPFLQRPEQLRTSPEDGEFGTCAWKNIQWITMHSADLKKLLRQKGGEKEQTKSVFKLCINQLSTQTSRN